MTSRTQPPSGLFTQHRSQTPISSTPSSSEYETDSDDSCHSNESDNITELINIMSRPAGSVAGGQGVAPSAPPSNGFKITQPDPYYGDRAKLRNYLVTVRLNFKLNPNMFVLESSKVMYAANLLRGAAFNWFEPRLTDWLGSHSTKEEETTRLFNSFDRFEDKLKEVFGNVDEQRTAERNLQQLKQTGSITEYHSRFQQLSARVSWDDSALASAFYYGLKPEIKEKFMPAPPTELATLCHQAIQYGNRIHELKLERGQHSFKGNYPRANMRKQRATDYGDPMDLDEIRRGKSQKKPRSGFKKTPRKGLSDAERERRRKENLCFTCGKPGHRSSECRGKTTPQLNALFAVVPKDEKADTLDEEEPNGGSTLVTQGQRVRPLGMVVHDSEDDWDDCSSTESEDKDADNSEELRIIESVGINRKHTKLDMVDAFTYVRMPVERIIEDQSDADSESDDSENVVHHGKIQVLRIRDNYILISTRYYKRGYLCARPICKDIGTQHSHWEYDNEEKEPRTNKAIIEWYLCDERECPKGAHTHQLGKRINLQLPLHHPRNCTKFGEFLNTSKEDFQTAFPEIVDDRLAIDALANISKICYEIRCPQERPHQHAYTVDPDAPDLFFDRFTSEKLLELRGWCYDRRCKEERKHLHYLKFDFHHELSEIAKNCEEDE
jgi:hypothetical protein